MALVRRPPGLGILALLLVTAVMACQEAPVVEPGPAPEAEGTPEALSVASPRPTGGPSAAPARSPDVETMVAPTATEGPRDNPGPAPETRAGPEASSVASPPPTGSPSAALARMPEESSTISEPSYTACHPHRDIHRWPWDVFVAWSPDGGEILFSQGPGLYAAMADGSAVRDIAQAWAFIGAERDGTVGTMIPFDIAPDGTQVAFATCGYPHPGSVLTDDDDRDVTVYGYELARVGVMGGTPQRLTANQVTDVYPAWSPDGRRVAFLQTGYWEARQLSTIGVDGTDARGIVRAPEGWGLALYPPVWSPDGRRLAFVGGGGDGGLALYTVAADGAELQQLSELRPLSEAVSVPAWSPDGRRLAYLKVEGGGAALYSIAADGTDERQLTTIDGWSRKRTGEHLVLDRAIGTVAWSPDGSKILFILNPSVGRRWAFPRNAMYVVDADGSRRVQLELLRPPYLRYRAAAWSPDGSRIAVVAEPVPPRESISEPYPIVLLSVAADGADVRVLAEGVTEDSPDYLPFMVALAPMAAVGPRPPAMPADPAACAAGVVVQDPPTNPGLVRDCEALLEIRDVLASRAELDWTADRPIAEWEGVGLGGSPPRVHELGFGGRELRGTVPPAIGDLSELRSLYLRNTRLTGGVPAELGRLTKLETLNLSENYLSGAVPAALGDLTALRTLSLGDNNIGGRLPEELGQLSGLQRLRMSRTLVSGPIPPSLGRLASLIELELQRNRLTGPIPAELGQLASLIELDLHGNRLRGPIPAEFGQLAGLQVLTLSNNRLTGPIPAEFGQLAGLQVLTLSNNRLKGPIPAELGQLANLQELFLAHNWLTGPIPAELGQLAGLQLLTLSNNQLTGPIPAELGELRNLEALTLRLNRLTGAIPAELGELRNLEALTLQHNRLTGCIPTGLQGLVDGRRLGLPDCE